MKQTKPERACTCEKCGITGGRSLFMSRRKWQPLCKDCRWKGRGEAISKRRLEIFAERRAATPVPRSKSCSKCGVDKPLSSYRPSKKGRLGLTAACRECDLAYGQAYRAGLSEETKKAANRRTAARRREVGKDEALRRYLRRFLEGLKKTLALEKACKECKAVKAIDHFGVARGTFDGKQGKCRACCAADASFKRAKDVPKYRLMCKDWRTRNPEKVAEVVATRRKKATVPTWGNKVAIKDLYRKAAALEVETGGKWSVDHIFPLKGKTCSGLHVESNLRIIPRRLNTSKNNKLPGDLEDLLWDPTGPDVFQGASHG